MQRGTPCGSRSCTDCHVGTPLWTDQPNPGSPKCSLIVLLIGNLLYETEFVKKHPRMVQLGMLAIKIGIKIAAAQLAVNLPAATLDALGCVEVTGARAWRVDRHVPSERGCSTRPSHRRRASRAWLLRRGRGVASCVLAIRSVSLSSSHRRDGSRALAPNAMMMMLARA